MSRSFDRPKPGGAPDAVAEPVQLVVSIVAWKGAQLTIDCLASVEAELRFSGNYRVILVDNASPDDSADIVERAIVERGWTSWVTFLRSPTNGGFSSGNNIAIRAMLETYPAAEYVLLLNPDTIVRPGAFEHLLNFMQSNPKVGIAGGLSEDPDGTPQYCCFRFPNIVSEASLYLGLGIFDRLFHRFLTRLELPQHPMQVDWVSGAHMMVRREVIDAIGLMDEGYFLYYEETDFTMRARKAGWSCWHVPDSRIVHLVGQSSGVTTRNQPPRRRPTYWFESRRRYFVLNHGRLYAIATDIAVLIAHSFWRVRRLVQRKEDGDPPRFLRDFFRNSSIVKGRKSLKPRQTEL